MPAALPPGSSQKPQAGRFTQKSARSGERPQGRRSALLDRAALLRPRADAAAGDVGDGIEAFALQKRRREPAALAAAADRRDRPVPGKLAEPVEHVAIGDVDRPGDAAALPLVVVADVEDERLVAVPHPR